MILHFDIVFADSKAITDLPTEILEKNLLIFDDLSDADLKNIGALNERFKLVVDGVAIKRGM